MTGRVLRGKHAAISAHKNVQEKKSKTMKLDVIVYKSPERFEDILENYFFAEFLVHRMSQRLLYMRTMMGTVPRIHGKRGV